MTLQGSGLILVPPIADQENPESFYTFIYSLRASMKLQSSPWAFERYGAITLGDRSMGNAPLDELIPIPSTTFI